MKIDMLKSRNEKLTEEKITDGNEKRNPKIIIFNHILSIFCLIMLFFIVIITLHMKFNVSKQVYRNYNYDNAILNFKRGIEQQGNNQSGNSDCNKEKHTQLFFMKNADSSSKLVFSDNKNIIKTVSFSKEYAISKYGGDNTIGDDLYDLTILFDTSENIFELQLIKYLHNNNIYCPVYIDDYNTNAKSAIYYDSNLNKYHLSICENAENLIKQKNIYCNGNGSIDIMSETEILNGYTASYMYKDYETSFGVHIKSVGEKIYRDGQIEISLENKNSQHKYEASINDGEFWEKEFKNNISFIGLLSGEYEILIREENAENYICSETINVPPINSKKASYIPVPPLLQLPELPTGCEITSLTMLLNYLGFEADKEVLADKYLSKGKYRASDPTETFVGDPKSTFAYGCFSNVIVKTAEKYLEENDPSKELNVINLTGCSPESIYAALDNGCPVIVWITVDLQEPQKGAVWTAADSKKEIQWLKGEHCVLLTGYDLSKKIVYANDPLKGLAVYDMELFEKRFEQMNKNAVIIMT